MRAQTKVERRITCIGCKKTPENIKEYKYSPMEGETQTDYVIRTEGTLDKFKPNQFYCTECYIKAGMPVYRSL